MSKEGRQTPRKTPEINKTGCRNGEKGEWGKKEGDDENHKRDEMPVYTQ